MFSFVLENLASYHVYYSMLLRLWVKNWPSKYKCCFLQLFLPYKVKVTSRSSTVVSNLKLTVL